LPIKRAPLLKVVVPVPPWSTPTVPVELRFFEASEKTTFDAVNVALDKLPPTLRFPELIMLAKVLAPVKVCALVVTIPGLVASAGLRLITLLLTDKPFAVLVPKIPAETAVGTIAVQFEPFHVKTWPLVVAVTVLIEFVPLPTITPFKRILLKPVPPWSIPTIPVELRFLEASVNTTLEAVRLLTVKFPELIMLAKVLAPAKL